MNLKKSVVRSIIIAVTVTVIICIAVIGLTIMQNNYRKNSSVASGEEKFLPEFSDSVYISYNTSYSPDLQTVVFIRDSARNITLTQYSIKAYYIRPEITEVINLDTIKCYDVGGQILIYQAENHECEGVYLFDIQYLKAEENSDLLLIANELVKTKEWRWIKFCSKFLYNAGDEEMKTALERYALGQFTQQEKEINKYSEVYAEEIIEIAKATLEQQ